MNCCDCPIRKYYAKAFDIHFGKEDCIVECPYKVVTDKYAGSK